MNEHAGARSHQDRFAGLRLAGSTVSGKQGIVFISPGATLAGNFWGEELILPGYSSLSASGP